MKKSIALFFILFSGVLLTQAQKKKELLDEITALRNQVKNTQLELINSKKREKLTLNKFEKSKDQIREAEKENQELLKTISGFTSVSNQKADNLSRSLETIKQKDTQLKVVNDALAKAEEEKLKQLTIFRDGLGTIGKVGFKNNVLVIEIPNTSLYGEENDTAIVLTESGIKNIQKIGDLLTKHPEYHIIIEGNSNAITFEKEALLLKDNWDLSALQGATIARALHTDYKIDPKRIEISAKSEYNTSGVETETRIIIKPKFRAFFSLIKENMKQ